MLSAKKLRILLLVCKLGDGCNVSSNSMFEDTLHSDKKLLRRKLKDAGLTSSFFRSS